VRHWSKLAAKWFGLAFLLLLMWLTVNADVQNEDNAGFRFARLQYGGGIPDYIKNWYTDYPAMDSHTSRYVGHHTRIDVGSPTLVKPSSAELFKYPLIYSVEPEQMVLDSRDAANLREYLERGGFWFADDFHGDREFREFLEQLHRVLPGASPVELKVSHPLFHSFYEINEIIQVTNDGIARCPECDQWENGPSGKTPKVFALQDSHGRICVLMAWNTDLGDGLEWADDPSYPSRYAAYSAKFLTNVVIYAMTH